jgi:universal stress protein A
MLPIKTILHPTDFSERSDYAFQLACSLARDHGARLVVLHVVLPPSAVALRDQVLATGSDDYRAPLLETLHKLRPPAEVPVEYRLNEGMAVAEILRVARETPCDLIVIGTQGRTGLKRVLMGSVAEQVVRNAPCPVLAVKAPLPPEESLAAATTAAKESFH